MDKQTLIKQSKTAYGQWCEQWQDHAKTHSKYEMKSLNDFRNIGIGKAILCVANGYSFEEEIETIKQYKDNVDILCCDKTLGHLLDNGITPTYCMVCDANVNYEKYMEPWKDKLGNTILFNNVCGNTEWSEKGNWKDKYFFINKDVIDSHLEFWELSGCPNFIPAGTNVSNAMLILLTQCDNEGRQNFFGYDKYLLIGYDYSWKHGGKYYAFDDNANGKDKYMCHIFFNSPTGTFCYTSGNLAFSKNWIEEYIRTFDLPVVQCAKDSLLQLKYSGTLKYQMQYKHRPEDSDIVKKHVNELEEYRLKINKIKHTLKKTSKAHHDAFLQSV